MVNLVYKVGGEKHCRPITTREELIAACNTPENIRNWNMYRQTGEDRHKLALVQVNYNCQVPDGGLLKGNKTVSPFFFYDIDCRDRDECRRIISQLLEMREKLGLVEVAESAGFGVHAVGRREPETTILENQVRISTLTQTEMDTNNKENNRVVFHGPINAETTPLLDEALFTESLTEEEAAAEYLRLKEREKNGEENVPAGAKKANKHYKPWEEGGEVTSSQIIQNTQNNPSLSPSSERIRFIARGVMKEKGLERSDFLCEGGRHTSVKIFLSGATQLLTQAETNAILAELMPEHWNDENIQRLVSDFYQNYTKPSQRLFKYQEQLFTQSQRLEDSNAEAQIQNAKSQALPQRGSGEGAEGSSSADADLERLTAGWNPPQLPARLPRLVQLLVKPFPEQYHPELVVTAFVVLGTIASHFRSTYIDGRVIAANLYAAIIAGSGKGKSWVTRLLELMCRHTLQEWDEGEWRKVRENQEMRDKMANAKDKPAKYHPKFRIMETMSKTSLLEVQTNLGENGMMLCNYTESDELANASRAQFSNLSVLLRKAWDLDKHRQFYMSEASCNTMCRLNAAILLTGTPKSVLSRLFADVESGMMQRFIPMMMPSLKRTFRPPKFMPLTPDEEAERDALLLKLWQKDLSLGDETLMLAMPKTQKAIEGWYDTLEERYNDGELTEAEADLSHRVGQFMQRAAIPFVALYGEEQREVLELVRWLGDFAYYNICHIFASRVAEEIKQSQQMLEAHTDKRVTAEPLLSRMPEVFTIQQFREERIRMGQSPDVKTLLSRYNRSGKVQRLEKGVYRNLTKVAGIQVSDAEKSDPSARNSSQCEGGFAASETQI